MRTAILALLLLVAGAAGAVEPGLQPNGDVVVVIPARVVKACQEGGGCALVNEVEFGMAVDQVIADNKKEICDYKEAQK